MDRRRRGHKGHEERDEREVREVGLRPAASARGPGRPSSLADSVLDLQASAGNRAVVAALQRQTVQRQPAGSRANRGGMLVLGSDEGIPLDTASWSVRVKTKLHAEGDSKVGRLEATGREIGNLLLHRHADASSDRLPGLLGAHQETGSLRLDRPSKDGTLPAVAIDLEDVDVVRWARTKGDDPTEDLEVAVGDLKVAGKGKHEAAGEAVGELRVVSGDDAWPPLPVLAWEGSESADLRPAGGFSHRSTSGGTGRITARIAAGMGLTRLMEAQAGPKRLGVVRLVPKDGHEMVIHDAIVDLVASLPDNPAVVKVGLVGEV